MRQKGFISLIILLVLAIFGILVFIIFSGGFSNKFPSSTRQITSEDIGNIATVVSSPTEKPNLTPNPSVEWKTYLHKDTGLSFKYPSDWAEESFEIETSYPLHGIVRLLPPGNNDRYSDGSIVIAYWDNPDKLSFQEMEDKYKNAIGRPHFLFSGGDFTVFKGYPSYAGNGVKECDPYLCDKVSINVGSYIFQASNIYDSIENSYKGIFDQILSTFKFTN